MARNLKKVENVKNRAKVKTEEVAILSIFDTVSYQ